MLAKLYYQTGGHTFPIRFPLVIPAIAFNWTKLEYREGEHENQFKNYQELLQGKDIIRTTLTAKDFVFNITEA